MILLPTVARNPVMFPSFFGSGLQVEPESYLAALVVIGATVVFGPVVRSGGRDNR